MKKCVLILDDDPELLMVCKKILEQKNYVVQTRLLCDDIIKDCKDVRPDIILMDLWIPNIGGEKAVNLLKENPSTVDIPAILFSANAEIDIIEKRAKADGVLKKPFEINVLLATIENILAGIKQ
jgi:CheY-like chemotaxis protein